VRLKQKASGYDRRMSQGTASAPGSGIAPPGLIETIRRPLVPAGPYLVVGLGRAGMAAAQALASRGDASAVRVWDAVADPPQLERAQALRNMGVDVWLGGDGLDALGEVETIIKSPGVPPEAPVVTEAMRRRLEIIDELEIGWRLVPSPTVAVTGTNGKSTVAALCVSVLEEHGLEPVLSGNTDIGPPLSELSLGEPPRSVVAEVSSYQAEYSPELTVDGAVFTNLTPEHLNRHGSMEAYAAAKRALFVREDRAVPLAALNVDDELGRTLAHDIEERGGRALRYGRTADADYRIVGCQWGLHDAQIEIDSPNGRVSLATRLPGAHNAANATSVLALADGLRLARDRTAAAIGSTHPVPGRFEVVDVGRPFDVVVDFAYGVDAVVAALATARALVAPRGGRVLTVIAIVGRAGPLTGREVGSVARERSDHLIVSGTSYRGEPRLATLAQLTAGARVARGGTVEVVIDRRQAIGRALAAARPGDLVAILGRGPITREATDARGGFRCLDDRQAVRELA
jgi:UDP-N-acetylmuramoylalanine--D-glutamate ligase